MEDMKPIKPTPPNPPVTPPVECEECEECSCGCVGYGHVPIQRMSCIYSPENSLEAGTVFGELDLNISEYGKVCKDGGVL